MNARQRERERRANRRVAIVWWATVLLVILFAVGLVANVISSKHDADTTVRCATSPTSTSCP